MKDLGYMVSVLNPHTLKVEDSWVPSSMADKYPSVADPEFIQLTLTVEDWRGVTYESPGDWLT